MSAPRKQKRKGQEISISVSEFKQWLSGVEDMQEDGWVPDATQWAKIRAKVELISEDDPVVESQPEPAAYNSYPPLHNPAPVYNPPVGYNGLADGGQQYRPAPRQHQPSMLEDDGIMMPQKTAQDALMDHGVQHGHNQFG